MSVNLLRARHNTGYHNAPIYLRIEENIDRIYIESDDLHITGRFDIVAFNRETLNLILTSLWILVIESKTLKPLSTSASRKCSPMHTPVLPSNLPSGDSSPIALPTSFSISAKTNTNTYPALASENAIAPSDCSKFSAPFVLGFRRSTKGLT